MRNLIAHSFHRFVIKKREVVVTVQHRVGRVEFIGNASFQTIRPRPRRKQIAQAVKKHIGNYVIPPITPVAAAQIGHLRIGVVHHYSPTVVFVEVILNHPHIVRFFGFVYPRQACANQSPHGIQGFVKFFSSLLPLPDVADYSIKSKSLLIKISFAVVLPDKRQKLSLGGGGGGKKKELYWRAENSQ